MTEAAVRSQTDNTILLVDEPSLMLTIYVRADEMITRNRFAGCIVNRVFAASGIIHTKSAILSTDDKAAVVECFDERDGAAETQMESAERGAACVGHPNITCGRAEAHRLSMRQAGCDTVIFG